MENGIAIIGRIPPPYGGVSVHIYRLLERLKAEKLPHTFYQLDSNTANDLPIIIHVLRGVKLFCQLAVSNHSLYHLHMSNPMGVILGGGLTKVCKKDVCFSLHGEGILNDIQNKNILLSYALKLSIRSADHIFAINPDAPNKLQKLGVFEDRITLMPAYIPPYPDEINYPVPKELKDFIKRHSPILASQGSFGSFICKNKEQKDIYRFDLLVQLLVSLKQEYPDVGLCTMISKNFDSEHRKFIYDLINKFDLHNSWYIYEGTPMPAINVYKQCDVFIRPTETDGDSVSVRECLDLEIPCIASDAVPRPEGCVLFTAGNAQECYNRVMSVLANPETYRLKLRKKQPTDHLVGLIKYYRARISHE